MSNESSDLDCLMAKLDKLVVNPKAKLGYDLFAGGLVWSDEVPKRRDAALADAYRSWHDAGLRLSEEVDGGTTSNAFDDKLS